MRDVEQWEIDERINDFWQPEDEAEAENFLAETLADDPQAQRLLFELCRLEIRSTNAGRVAKAAEELIEHMQREIALLAENDKLPLTDKPDDDEARAAARHDL